MLGGNVIFLIIPFLRASACLYIDTLAFPNKLRFCIFPIHVFYFRDDRPYFISLLLGEKPLITVIDSESILIISIQFFENRSTLISLIWRLARLWWISNLYFCNIIDDGFSGMHWLFYCDHGLIYRVCVFFEVIGRDISDVITVF